MEKISIDIFAYFLPVPQCIPWAACTSLATILCGLNDPIPIECLYWAE